MKFLHPSGLLLLLGVALFLLACLFKPRYQEHRVSSLYLWKLSERFRKKRLPIHRLKRVLLFLLQLSMLLLGVLLSAQPQLALRGSGKDYVAILDASASMRLADGEGTTRFERAKAALLSRVASLDPGTAVTVITTAPARLAERSSSRSEIEYAVSHAVCGWDTGDLDGALALAQELLWLRPNAQVEFYTDRSYAETENLSVVQTADSSAWNAVVSGLTGRLTAKGASFESTVASFGRDADITVALYVDGALKGAQIASCSDGVPVAQTWFVEGLSAYSRAQVVASVQDGLAEDNVSWLCAEPAAAIRALLVSASPFYLQNALSAFPSVSLETVSAPEEIASLSGYDVYIFDGCQPDALPKDGSTWLIDPQASPAETGVTLGEEWLGGALTPALPAQSPAAQAVMRDLTLTSASALRFREIEEYGSLSPALLCGEMPVLLAGTGAQNTRLIVLSLDLHDTNLPLLSDFVLLVCNMLSYSMPSMLPALSFASGEPIEATVLPFCEEVYLQSPDGSMISLAQENGVAAFTAGPPGVYTLLQKRPDTLSKYSDFSVHIPQEESNPGLTVSARRLALSAERAEATASDPDDLFDPTAYLAAALLLILIVECVVFNREQF
ncbi:MAG: VWA domain-containing protein [Clostridia bacterium]|nr:VWA domain-containing protein [Clostridia bacterium]